MRFVLSSLSVVALLTQAAIAQEPLSIDYNCDPCLERRQYAIKAIVHGTSTDPVWQQIQSAAIQASKDMNIEFDFQLHDKFDLTKQASDIRTFVDGDFVRSGLIVTIPNQDVADAVKEAVDAGIPVVGINTGAQFGKDIGVLDFVAPDDFQGGLLAGETFLAKQPNNVGSVLYINDEQGNDAMAKRLNGLEQALGGGVNVQSLSVDGTNPTQMTADINGQLAGCSYQAVLLSGTRSVQATIDAYVTHGCTISNQPLGVFDTSEDIYHAIGSDQLSFAISNNQWFQGSFGTVLASLAVTTGKSLASSADIPSGAYLPGPELITKTNLPTDTKKVCENDAFPVCPNDKNGVPGLGAPTVVIGPYLRDNDDGTVVTCTSRLLGSRRAGIAGLRCPSSYNKSKESS